MHFADELIGRVRELGHPLCVGLDPHLDLIPSPFRKGSMRSEDPATSEVVVPESVRLPALRPIEKMLSLS